MIIRSIVWLLTFLGALPILLITVSFGVLYFRAPDFVKPFPNANIHHTRYFLFHAGTKLSADAFSSVIYPRTWVTLVGLLGVLCMLIFVVYTLYIKY